MLSSCFFFSSSSSSVSFVFFDVVVVGGGRRQRDVFIFIRFNIKNFSPLVYHTVALVGFGRPAIINAPLIAYTRAHAPANTVSNWCVFHISISKWRWVLVVHIIVVVLALSTRRSAYNTNISNSIWFRLHVQKVRYYRVTGKSLVFPRLKILIVIISTGCLLCAVLFLLSLNALLEGMNWFLIFLLSLKVEPYFFRLCAARNH